MFPAFASALSPKALLDAHLSKHVSQKQLIDSGILLDMTPEELALERRAASERLSEGLGSRHSLEELIQRGLLTVRGRRGMESRSPTLVERSLPSGPRMENELQ